MLARERRAGAGDVLEDQLKRILRDELEAFDRVGASLEEAQQLERALRALDAGPGDGAAGDVGHQAKRHGGDHSERPLGADQQLVEAVAAIVFLQARKAVVDRAVGKHGFEAGDERAHRPELQHLGAAGVGRGEAADGAAPARAERQREAHADLVRGIVQRREHHAGFGDREAVVGADRTDAVHPAQREQDRGPVGRRRRSRDHAGVAALRNERHAMFGGEADDLDHLVRRRGCQHRSRGSVQPAAPVGHPRLDFRADR